MKNLGRYDAIVVGARVAGSITAAALAQRGWKVLVVDKATFPSTTLSTHLFFSDTLRILRNVGLLDPVLAIDAPRLRVLRFPYVVAAFPLHDGFDYALCIRREVLDTLLVEQLRVRPGITVLTGATVKQLLWSHGRVSGVEVVRADQRWVAHAPLVVGADGRASTVARAVDARIEEHVPPLFAWYYTYFADVPHSRDPSAAAFRSDFPELGAEYAAAFLFPCDGGLTLVGFGVEHRAFAAFRTDVRRHFVQGLQRIPAVQEQLLCGRPIAGIRGTGHLPNFLRQASGPGWALVGDAGCHKDPHTVQGIGDAARSAWILAQELATVDPQSASLDEALARYLAEHAPRLRAETARRFGERLRPARAVWRPIAAF
ncbi:MAG: NAD(P)/FAD-dependent oxidoreductase, partial [Thermomicrobium sp.]|nr:NAD(P)/FAD-dependent oxidoreductase [Thermomicrobium sp.]